MQEGGQPRLAVRVLVEPRSVWYVIGAVLATAALLWAAWQLRTLLWMMLLALFFSLALEPAARAAQRRWGWARGRSVAVVLGGGLLALVLLVVLLIPGLVELADRIGAQGPGWIENLNAWAQDQFDVSIIDESTADAGAATIEDSLGSWAEKAFGAVTGIASQGAALLFSLTTIIMFTVYFTVDSPRLTRLVFSWFPPTTQERLAWTTDQAIVQTGGYFYSRSLLMLINGTGYFVTMLLVGMPVSLALPAAAFAGFTCVFIPVVGTYLGAAVPILLTLAADGVVGALIILGYTLLYQALENAYLNPRISAGTMDLSGLTAFTAALAGGLLAGPIGAFVALPVAALVTALFRQYGHSYDVIHTPSRSDSL